MYQRLHIKIITGIAILATAVMAGGFIAAIGITNSKQKSAAQEPKAVPTKQTVQQHNNYNILVLGDSLARGTGDETGNGFSGDFAKGWKGKTTKEIKVTNLGINGAVSSGLLKVAQGQEAQSFMRNADMLMISIGGNEISKFKNLDSSANLNFSSMEERYLSNLGAVYKMIRSLNKSCMILFLGLYNPYGSVVGQENIANLMKWNADTEQLINKDQKGMFIPTYDLFRYNLGTYLSVDQFHPNSTGYQAIADRMLKALENYR